MAEAGGLRVQTREITTAEGFNILDHIPENAVVFMRFGQGLIGSGEAIILRAKGTNRIEDLAESWRELVSKAEIDDVVGVPGTGLVGFGSISFAGDSSYESVLTVPRVILGTRDGRSWITTINSAEGVPIDESFAIEKQTYRVNAPLKLRAGEMTPERFLASAQVAVDRISQGKLQKVVLARDLVSEIPEDFDMRNLLRNLAQEYPSCWVYSVNGSFGASPELLVRVSHRQVSARVLAGTAARGETAELDQQNARDLATSPKNISEHGFALDSMVEALSPFCTTVDSEDEPFSLALPNLWHLASDVYGVLKENRSVLDLAARLHPTAAVAGTPRLEAQKLIAELEPFDRAGYAGPVGWIGADGDGEWAIALRGGMVSDGKLTAFAGCGLVLDSNPASELAETELKFSPVRHAIA